MLKKKTNTAVREEISFSSVFVRQAVVATQRFRVSFMNGKRITLPGDVHNRVSDSYCPNRSDFFRRIVENLQ